MNHTIELKRRSFLKIAGAASGGLLLGFNWLGCNAPVEKIVKKSLPENWYDLNAFLKIGENGLVTIFSPNPEIGQNVKTSMPMIIAEEMDIDWNDVLVEQAPLSVDFDRQVAGGSQSIRYGWESLRKTGATARNMLLQAAANKWSVPIGSLKTDKGIITNEKGETITYGELAQAAMAVTVPEEVDLKDPKDFKIIGNSKRNVDIDVIVTGKSAYGLDTKRSGMVYAKAIRPPAFGMTLKSFDDANAKSVNGVIDVFKFAENKIAVIADNTWAAMKGAKSVIAEWDAGNQLEDSINHDDKLLDLLNKRSAEPARNDGDVDQALAAADEILERTYSAPFLPHNCLEPMNFFAHVTEEGVDCHGPIQTPKWTQNRVAKVVGVEPEKVKIGMTRMGGGFGRRLYGDFAEEAAEISMLSKKPVQLVFSREDDMAAGTYRPASKYKMRAGIKDGKITAYHLTEACVNGNMYDLIPNFFPARAIPNLRIDLNNFKSNITTGAWRAPYTNFLAFAEQSFFDELAGMLKKDAVQLRLELFEIAKNNPDESVKDGYSPERSIGVTKLVAEKSNWGKTAPGVYQGISVYYSHNTHVAEVADVIMKDGLPVVKKITCAVDCGILVNPLAATNQVEGGIIDGIGHAMYGDLTFEKGAPSAKNFDKYRLIRMSEAPEIDVHFVESNEKPTGLGEPSLPPAGGAIANAIYKATGVRLYKQPFKLEEEVG